MSLCDQCSRGWAKKREVREVQLDTSVTGCQQTQRKEADVIGTGFKEDVSHSGVCVRLEVLATNDTVYSECGRGSRGGTKHQFFLFWVAATTPCRYQHRPSPRLVCIPGCSSVGVCGRQTPNKLEHENGPTLKWMPVHISVDARAHVKRPTVQLFLYIWTGQECNCFGTCERSHTAVAFTHVKGPKGRCFCTCERTNSAVAFAHVTDQQCSCYCTCEQAMSTVAFAHVNGQQCSCLLVTEANYEFSFQKIIPTSPSHLLIKNK